jgi:hypothetical protein
MLAHPMTDQWNDIFLNEWNEMDQAGLLKGVK